MHLLYNIGIYFFGIAVRLASFFGNPKAALWVKGRKNWHSDLATWRDAHPGQLIWIHAASLGEFEQGRPIIEAIKQKHPQVLILLTFFSPSGYEIRKNYIHADKVIYLPADTPSNATLFVNTLRPALTLFVKYEYWANYFFEIKKSGSLLWVVSGIFRENQRFFGLQRSFWSTVLNQVDYFFLQNKASQDLLSRVCNSTSLVNGDTRYDRVEAISREQQNLPVIESFLQHASLVVVGGSTYSTEETLLRELLLSHPEVKCLLAPHDISENRIKEIAIVFGSLAVRYSEWNGNTTARCLIIDNMGMLSQLYRYGQITLIGGGFGKGIHNILEAAVYGSPILFGPKYQKFQEAQDILRLGGGSSGDERALRSKLDELLLDKNLRQNMGLKSRELVESNLGAVSKIIETLENQRVLEP